MSGVRALLAVLVAVIVPEPTSVVAAMETGAGSLAAQTTGRASCSVPLSPLQGDHDSIARAVNSHGLAAGTSAGQGRPLAVIWDRRGQPRPLQPLPEDYSSEAAGINDRGEVVGTSHGAATSAVRWDRDGRPVRLVPLPGDHDSEAQGINIHGEVAGFSRGRGSVGGALGGFVVTAVVWDRDGKPRRLSPPKGYDEAHAQAINDLGQVAGFAYRVGSRHDRAVRWSGSGKPTLLARLGQRNGSEGYGISASGVVAGDSDGDTTSRPCGGLVRADCAACSAPPARNPSVSTATATP
jgi:uncharacterized membrane protein